MYNDFKSFLNMKGIVKMNFAYLLDTASGASAAASQTVSGTSSAAAQSGGDMLSMLLSLLPMVLIIVVFYFLLIRPQKKRDKETQNMRNSIQVGDEVVTVGGLIGIVVSIKEDNIVIETGSDRSKVRIKRWAIQSNETIHDDQAK